jgi:hypothetical protein
LTYGTSTIVHINRLKRASDQAVDSKVLPHSRSSKTVKLSKRSKESVPKVKADKEIEQQDPQITRYSQTLNSAENLSSSDESETLLAQESTTDPDWTPGTSIINRKSQNSDTADGIAYRLRSRLVSRSERETEIDKQQAGETVRLSGSEPESTQINTSPGRNEAVVSHSYNLRSKTSK